MTSPALRNVRANSGITFRTDANTVLWLPGQDDPQSSTIRDRSGNGHDGTITTALWTRNSKGLWGLAFDGDDYVDITASLTSLASLTTGTLTIWITMPDATPGTDMYPLAFGDTDANESLVLRMTGGAKFQCFLQIAGDVKWNLDTDGVVITDNTPTRLTLTQDATEPVLYVNGEKPTQAFISQVDKTLWFAAATGLDNGFLGKGSNFNIPNALAFTGNIYLPLAKTVAVTAERERYEFNQQRGLFGV